MHEDWVDPEPHTVYYPEEPEVVDHDFDVDEYMQSMHHDNDAYPTFDDEDEFPKKEEGDHFYNHILDNVDPEYNEGHHVHSD